MAPVDPDLLEYLELSSERSAGVVLGLRQEVADARRALDDTRRELAADRELEADRFRRLHRRLEDIDRRCSALVVEEEDEDGATVIRARPARVGLDVKTIIGLAVTLVTILATSPVLIELLK